MLARWFGAIVLVIASCGLLFLAEHAHAACDTSAARAADKWTGPDKVMHLGGSAVLGVFASTVVDSDLGAFGLAMVPGVLKEASDSRQCGNFFSPKDLVADAIGAYLGVRFGHLYIVPVGRRNAVGLTVLMPL